eukprot:INCI5892.6.p1 GENE.INCI5892.6~~INCI5892.6.p1  ORF type:complete len:1025 (+),score=147.95 INCI5892.6:330-3077(+)
MRKGGPPPKLEVFAVGGWKDGYFCDRGPRLTCRLTHPPAGVTSLPITVRTQTRDGVSSLPLVVKQEVMGSSMKNWQHVFTIRATTVPTNTSARPEPAQVLVKAKTRKSMEQWLTAINNPKKSARKLAGVLWLKPNEELRHFRLEGDTLSMSSAESTPVLATWTIAASSNPDNACAKHFERTLTLRAENRWQTTVVFAFQLGFFISPQQFVATAPKQYNIRPATTQWFEVRSSNRHTGRDGASKATARKRGGGRKGRGAASSADDSSSSKTASSGSSSASSSATSADSPRSAASNRLALLSQNGHESSAVDQSNGGEGGGLLGRPVTHEKRTRSLMAGRRNRPPSAGGSVTNSSAVAAGIRQRSRQRSNNSLLSLGSGGSGSSNSIGTMGTSGSGSELVLGKKLRHNLSSSTGLASGGVPIDLSSIIADELRDVHLGYTSSTAQAFKLEVARLQANPGGTAGGGRRLSPEDRDKQSSSMRSLLGLAHGQSRSQARGLRAAGRGGSDVANELDAFHREREISALSIGSINSMDSWRSQVSDGVTGRELSTDSVSALLRGRELSNDSVGLGIAFAPGRDLSNESVSGFSRVREHSAGSIERASSPSNIDATQDDQPTQPRASVDKTQPAAGGSSDANASGADGNNIGALRLTPASLLSLRNYLEDLCQTMGKVTEFEPEVSLESLTDVHLEAVRLVQCIEHLRVLLARNREIWLPPHMQPCTLLPGQQKQQRQSAAWDPSDFESASPGGSPKEYIRHRVTKDDTLLGVCLRYNIDATHLKALNGFTKDHIWTKEFLFVPKPPPLPISAPLAIQTNGGDDLQSHRGSLGDPTGSRSSTRSVDFSISSSIRSTVANAAEQGAAISRMTGSPGTGSLATSSLPAEDGGSVGGFGSVGGSFGGLSVASSIGHERGQSLSDRR